MTSGALRVYGVEVSYFTGKLEAYLRYKEIPYELVPDVGMRRARRETGIAQMPAVELPDGRFMSDTTPMIEWLEREISEPRVIPGDPLQAFASRLLEDYADEWLWRPAMHYRWFYPADAALLSRKISGELMGHIPLPGAVKRLIIRTRQRTLFTRGDGITRETRAHVEGIYTKTLDQLRVMFAARPFVLGGAPTLLDFGLFGSMFRHFGLDPTASRIMRDTAPEVYEWLARLWNARASRTKGDLVPGIPEDWGPVLDEVGSAYLPYLAANADAWQAGSPRFDVEIQGVRYRRIRTSRYRVWCLEMLRLHYDLLAEPDRERARALLERHGCLEPLFRVQELESGIERVVAAPFARGHSMTGLGRAKPSRSRTAGEG